MKLSSAAMMLYECVLSITYLIYWSYMIRPKNEKGSKYTQSVSKHSMLNPRLVGSEGCSQSGEGGKLPDTWNRLQYN